MKSRILSSVLAAFIVLFGALLFYDAVLLFLIHQFGESRHHFGFDLKESAIALVAMVAGTLWLLRLLAGYRDQRLIAAGLILFGLFVPMLFGLEIRGPLWFTEREKVTALSGDIRGSQRSIRARYIRYVQDSEPAQADDLAAEILRAEKRAAEEAKAAEATALAEAESALMLALEQERLELAAARRAAAVSEDRAAVETEPADGNSYEDTLYEACGNLDDLAPESTRLVELATGSIRTPSIVYGPNAEALLKEAIAHDSKNVIAYSRLSLLYLKKRAQPDRAIKLLIRAVEALPNCGALHFDLGNAYSAQRNFQQARVELTKAIDIAPEVPASYHYNLANTYLRAGDAASSVAHYIRALEANPMHNNARNNLTRAYVQAKRYDKLFQMYAKDADGLRRIGVTVNREKEHDMALEFFRRSLVLETNVETYVHIGIAYGNLGNMVEAKNAAQQALKIEPGHEGALAVLRLANR